MNEPKCPYCGMPMCGYSREYGLARIQVKCTNCGACGPTAEIGRRQPWNYTRERLKAEEDKADEAAMRRPLQKPLTLCELSALIDTDDDVVTWCESCIDAHAYANIWYQGKCIDRDGDTLDVRLMAFDAYNKTWRCWATRPTDEEREAAPWEE